MSVCFLAARRDARRFVIEGVGEGDHVDVPRERGIDDEAHRHVAALVEGEVLRREAEALGLVEVGGDLRGSDVGYRLRSRGTPAQVVGVELRREELARMHLDGAY